jgi:hypothetical protein
MLLDEDGNIWFRQSWLETANRCNERGRLAIVHPEFDEPINDAALIGTATHHEIACDLREEIAGTEPGELAHIEAMRLCETKPVKWTKWTLPTQLAEHAARCAVAWTRDIKPLVPRGGQVEVDFTVPLFTTHDHLAKRDRVVGLKGTIDYADPDGVLWDWKTGSKKYEQRARQRTGVQPTTYATAAMHGGLGDYAYRYPILFKFGVMVRGDSYATTQIVPVQRTRSHELWLTDQLRSYVNMIVALGTTKPWIRNEDHFLCSSTWCPFWSICKGARLTDAEDTWRP